MKKTLLYISVFMATVLLGSSWLNSQELKINHVNSENYPTLEVEVSAIDDTGEEQVSRDFINDLKIYDAGTLREIIAQQCANLSTRFSLIVHMDRSTSMSLHKDNAGFATKPNRRWDAINEALQELVTKSFLLNSENNEFALMSFSGASRIDYEFRTDFGSQQLKDDLKAFADTASFNNMTDFDAALLGINSADEKVNGIGAIEYSQNARFQPIIIILTDGKHNRAIPSDIHVAEIDAAVRNAEKPPIIYVMTYGEPMDEVLSGVASASGGRSYADLASDEVIPTFEEIIDDLGDKLRTTPPCSFEMESSCEGGEIYATATIGSQTYTSAPFSYSVDEQYLPKLTFSEPSPAFRDASSNNPVTQTITLAAENNDIKFSNKPTFLNDDGSVNTDFTVKTNMINKSLAKDASMDIIIEYKPSVKQTACLSGVSVDFTAVSTACSQDDFSPIGKFFYAEDIRFDKNGIVDQKITVRPAGSVKNYSCENAKITDIKFSDEIGGTFGHEATLPLAINKGQDTKKITYTFIASSPPVESSAKVCFTVEFDGSGETKEYCATISGKGAGEPEITITQLNIENFVCSSDTPKDASAPNLIQVKVENVGLAKMNINSISASGSVFEVVNTSFTEIEPGDSKIIYLSFSPNAPGSYNAVLTVDSDSKNSDDEAIQVSANLEDHSFSLSDNDFGLRCVGESFDIDVGLAINNNDETGFVVTGNSSLITFPAGNTIAPATGDQTFTINIPSDTETPNFSESLTFTNQCGEFQVVQITGNISRPDISGTAVLQASQGVPSTTTVVLTNNFGNPVTDLDYEIDPTSPAYTMIDINPSSAGSALANSTFNLVLDYTFSTQFANEALTIFITSDDGCVDDEITVNLLADLARGQYTIEDSEEIVGKVFDLDIGIDPGTAYEGIDDDIKIETRITFNSNVIVPLDQASYPMSPTSNGGGEVEIIANLDKGGSKIPFVAKNGGADRIDDTDIVLEFLKSDKDPEQVYISDATGLFALKRIPSELEVEDTEGKIGDDFTIRIKFPKELLSKLDPDIHKSLEGYFTYNASLFSATANTVEFDEGAYKDDNLGYYVRKIKFKFDLKAPEDGSQQTIATPDDILLSFVATLGDAATTTMNLENITTEGGEVDIPASSIKQGVFTLLDLSVDNDGRVIQLFDASSNLVSGIAENLGNPIKSPTSIDFTVMESGQHKIWLLDLQGNKVADLVSKYFDRGKYQTVIDPAQMANGSYIIIYQTPTQFFTVKMTVLK